VADRATRVQATCPAAPRLLRGKRKNGGMIEFINCNRVSRKLLTGTKSYKHLREQRPTVGPRRSNSHLIKTASSGARIDNALTLCCTRALRGWVLTLRRLPDFRSRSLRWSQSERAVG
jgi:hypothetical protein